MTGKPQFEHKNRRFFVARSFKSALVVEFEAGGNAALSFGLMALLDRSVAACGRPGQTGLLQ